MDHSLQNILKNKLNGSSKANIDLCIIELCSGNYKKSLLISEKIIYDNKKLKELSYNKITKLFNNAKHIFLIDKEETYNNKITIKEVIYFTPNQVE